MKNIIKDVDNWSNVIKEYQIPEIKEVLVEKEEQK